MAACGTFNQIVDKPTLFDSLSSWKRLQSLKSFEDSYFTEILSDINRKEFPESSTSTSSTSLCTDSTSQKALESSNFQSSNNFLGNQTTRRSLSMCTEGLGFESSDDMEDSMSSDWEKELELERSRSGRSVENLSESRRFSRKIGGGIEFPPPITSIGKRFMCLRSYRRDGRFILKEVRVPVQEVLHASREDGRLKLQFIQSDDDDVEESDDCGCEDDDDDDVEESDDGEIGREC